MSTAGTVLITGGTGSLGFHTAAAIAHAHPSSTIVITGRDASAAGRKAAEIAERTGAEVHGLALDMSSLEDVRRFVAALPAGPPLCAVVCNAGLQVVDGLRTSRDGYEATFAVNHLAHFLLVQLLLPRLSAPARIVLVASDTHDPKRHTGMPAPRYLSARDLALPPPEQRDPSARAGRRRYTTSKLCNVLMTYELARRIPRREHGVTVNAFDPGLMPGTGLARDYTGMQALAWNHLLPAATVLPGLNIHTPRRSAAALARLVTDPALATVTGQYFSGHRQIRSSRDSYDTGKAADLWATSLDLTAPGLY